MTENIVTNIFDIMLLTVSFADILYFLNKLIR